MATLDYYDRHADQFVQSTLDVDMESLYHLFLENIPEYGHILDLGCGSGRDTLAFKNKGYQVEALDYSKALVEKATALTGIPVRYQSFYDLNEHGIYDGIWACASLLHCERAKLPEVVRRIYRALRRGGVCYMSFKYGSTDRQKDGRVFTDLDEEQAKELLHHISGIQLLNLWLTEDRRPDRPEMWLNLLWKKDD
jgi:SAM-dependent methyltransferase